MIILSKNISKDYKEGSEIIGVHLEGPFISIEYCGAQLPKYILKPNVDTFKHFEKVSNNTIKFVTMAVEEDDNNDIFILENYCKKCGITGFKKFSNEWTIVTEAKEDIDYLNNVRLKVITPLIKLCIGNKRRKIWLSTCRR